MTGNSFIPAIQFQDVSVTFSAGSKRITAISEFNLHIQENEILCIVGPSGSGKSTVLNLIGGFISASTGEVRVFDQLVMKSGPDRGIVFQDFILFPWLKVRENIGIGLKVQGYREIEIKEVVSRFVQLMGLEGFEDSYPSSLSGGMKQRVALARSLATSPKILLMDEPFGSLDSQTRGEMQELALETVAKENLTVVFVTHDIAEAILLGDRVCVLSKRPGKIIDTVDIQFPSDRGVHLIGSEEFENYRQKILSILKSDR